MIAFIDVYKTKRGDTVEAIGPRHAARKHADYIKRILGRRYKIIAHEDGAYTVQWDGLSDLTFELTWSKYEKRIMQGEGGEEKLRHPDA